MALRWLAIDPGPEQSGYVIYEGGKVKKAGVSPNADLLENLHPVLVHHLAIEMIASYGMAVGKDVFETCVWVGRFLQAWACDCECDCGGCHRAQGMSENAHRIFRKDVKLHLCGNPRAKDANIRQALIDRLGPVGTKKNPGPLYGVTSHAWAALAVAVTADDMHGIKT